MSIGAGCGRFVMFNFQQRRSWGTDVISEYFYKKSSNPICDFKKTTEPNFKKISKFDSTSEKLHLQIKTTEKLQTGITKKVPFK